MSVIRYVPRTLDLNSLFSSRMDQESAAVFVHRLYMAKLFSSKSSEFTHIRAAVMRQLVGEKKYTRIKNRLVDSGVIECDDIFVSGRKSLGYKLKSSYADELPRIISIRGKRLVGLLKTRQRQYHTAEQKWVFENLKKLDYLGSEPSIPSQWILVDRILRKDHLFKVDRYGRVHTTVTGLKRGYRQMLALRDGSELSEIDISAAQPSFLVLFAQKDGEAHREEDWSKNRVIEISKNILDFNIHQVNTNNSPTLLHLNDGSFCHFRDFLANGNFYQDVARYCGFDFKPKTAKKRFFVDILYGERSTEYFQAFQTRFPAVARLVSLLKKNDYRNLSHALQRVESIFVSRVLGRLLQEKPDMFISTIHDSFMVPTADADWVSAVLEEELVRVGIPTRIRTSRLRVAD